MRKNRSFVKTYLASMKIGGTIEIARTLASFFFYYFCRKRYIYLCFEGTIGRLNSVMCAVLKAGSNEGGAC